MGKKYGKSGMEKEYEDEYFSLRDRGYSPEEAEDIVEGKIATKRTLNNLFGHNGW